MLGEGSQSQPGDDAVVDGNRRIERRSQKSVDSPVDALTQLPALVMLERIAVPTLAIASGDGTILFANAAFAEMVGYEQDGLAGLAFFDMFHTEPAPLSMLSRVDALANMVVELRHREGWTVRARMSKSSLMRRDDPVVLVTFENLTERFWADER